MLVLLIPAPALAAACLSALPVQMTITSELTESVPSASVGFHVLMRNTSDAVVDHVALLVQVEKKDGTVVDRFIAPVAVAILAGSPAKADFIWKIPSGLSSGAYDVIAELVPADSRIADARVVGIQAHAETAITISGGVAAPAIQLTKVNGQRYAGEVATIASGTAQVVAATLNGTPGPYRGTFVWRLWAADARLGSAPIDSAQQSVELHPSGTSDVTYTLTDSSHAGYYLEGELSDGKTNSYVDFWLARDGEVFSELACAPARAANSLSTLRTEAIVALVGLLLLLGLGWELFEKRRRP